MLPLLRLNSKDVINDLNSITPNQFDNIANYSDAYDGPTPNYNGVLGDNRNSGEYWKPRGSFKLNAIGKDCDANGNVSTAPTATTAPNEVQTTYLEFEFTEPLMFLSPFTAFDSNGSSIFGVQNLSLNFTLESENCRAIRLPDLGDSANVTASVQIYKDSELQFEF